MNGDNLIGNERVLISQLLSGKGRHTQSNEFAVEQNCQETNRMIEMERTTPQSGHYPITGWAHASRDSHFNCSCILIGIMRFVADTHRLGQQWAEGDASIWQWYQYLKWSITRMFFLRVLSWLKFGIFHITMWLLFSLFRMCQLYWHVNNISSIF